MEDPIVHEIMRLLGISSEEVAEALSEETKELRRVREVATLEEARNVFYACNLRSNEANLAREKWSVLGMAEAQKATTVPEATKAFFGSFVGSEGRKVAIRKI